MNSEIPLDKGEAQVWNIAPTVDLRGRGPPTSRIMSRSVWLTLPALVGLITCERRPERDLTVLFSLCDAGRGVPQVLNPFILIIWAPLKVVGLRMLSAGEHLAILCPNLSITRP